MLKPLLQTLAFYFQQSPSSFSFGAVSQHPMFSTHDPVTRQLGHF